MNKAMFAGIYIGFMKSGLQIERLENRDDGVVFLYSVPKSADEWDVHGKQMSGKHLASRIKYMLEDFGVKFADCRYRIRDEHWDKAKAAAAEKAAYKDMGYKRWQM